MAAEDRRYHIVNHNFPRIAKDIISHPVWIRPTTTTTTTTTSTTTTEATTLNETITDGNLSVEVHYMDMFSSEIPLQEHTTELQFSAVATTTGYNLIFIDPALKYVQARTQDGKEATAPHNFETLKLVLMKPLKKGLFKDHTSNKNVHI